MPYEFHAAMDKTRCVKEEAAEAKAVADAEAFFSTFGGVILKIEWRNKSLKGTLPVGDLFMPFLTHMDLGDNNELTGEI